MSKDLKAQSQSKLNWNINSSLIKILSDDFIKKFNDKVKFSQNSTCQILCEDFI